MLYYIYKQTLIDFCLIYVATSDTQYNVRSDTIQFERDLLATNIVFNR